MKVLVVAVHPDDETLGCGGTLLRHRAQGDELYWLIVTAMAAEGGFSSEQMMNRNRVITMVADAYGFSGVHQLNFPATRLDEIALGTLVESFKSIFDLVEPEILYLPFLNDVHSDHRQAFAGAYSCTKSFRRPGLRRVLMMETVSETEFAPAVTGGSFAPNVFIDISPYLTEKIRILNLYDSELAAPPFPRSLANVEALASFRGASSGFRYAESFMLLVERVREAGFRS